ncbi:nucleotide-binding domain-containing protein [Hesseltinella vesiculosa]|uniref:NADPH:adrenodoxin oxidoreductase, mitochondrial n=1 Tax=Hesseltinella vesiculosa TaxID=101127 RepID=A0A1X2GUU1_9FUNG|nr:nucleotide-binding domain-containing protein [Hesseltinella vesiculosa]
MLKRTFATATRSRPFRLAVVGSGPAGFYTCHRLLKEHDNTQIDMFDALPVPHGLVRYGVAPDHPEVKNVMTTFDKVAEDPRFRFIGNVSVGTPTSVLQVADLKAHYDALLFTYGASEDRHLGIPNEDAYGSTSARTFVGWYNGLPRDQDLQLPLQDTDTAVVIGQGNVALDVARILLTPIDDLRKTDITEAALEALSKSKIKNVHVVGRRGPLQASFTTKELREQLSLPNVRFEADQQWIQQQIAAHEDAINKQRPLKRLMGLLAKGRKDNTGDKSWHLKFLRSPVEILADNGNVSGIRYEMNELQGESFDKQRAVGTGQFEDQACGLVLRSIGYKSMPMPGVPFDAKRGLVPNAYGKILQSPDAAQDDTLPGMYTAGWLKRGPTGVIVSTMSDAYDTADTILTDLKNESPMLPDDPQRSDDIVPLIQQRGVQPVSYRDWKKIEAAEFAHGVSIGKPREKFTSVPDMLHVLQPN